MHTLLFDDVAWSDWSNVEIHALETCHAHPVRSSGLMTWRGRVLATGFIEFAQNFSPRFVANSNWPADLMARITSVILAIKSPPPPNLSVTS
jgi:hypothetical protein